MQFLFLSRMDTGAVKRFGLGATNKLFLLSTYRHVAKQNNTAIALTSLETISNSNMTSAYHRHEVLSI